MLSKRGGKMSSVEPYADAKINMHHIYVNSCLNSSLLLINHIGKAKCDF